MVFWQLWEVCFQAFMIFIGVGIIWLRFIEPLFANRQVSVILMIIVAVALAALRITWGVIKINKQRRELQARIRGLNGESQVSK